MYQEVKSIFLVIVLGFANIFFNPVYSQQFAFSIQKDSCTVKEVLNTIEKNSQFIFFYLDDAVNLSRKVSIQVENVPVETILTHLFKGTGTSFHIFDRQIVIAKARTENDAFESSNSLKTLTILGSVSDSYGPIAGANVIIKGKHRGTATDKNGRFMLSKIEHGDTLVASFVGYNTEEIQINDNRPTHFILHETMEKLEEVVVIGYGKLGLREITSAHSTIRNGDLISGATASPLQTITGKISNLNVVSLNGADPNTDISLQLRGVNSINAGQGPLIVVDGIPGGNISDIQREDIEAIDVLKDASAAAIYGTRGSGGVILITTREAESGKVKLSYNSDLSIETIRRKADVLSSDEFVKKGLGQDLGAKVNWFEQVVRTRPFTNRHTITLTGGSKNIKTYASLFYKKANGIAIESGRKEVGGRLNLIYSLFEDRLRFSGRASYSNIWADNVSNSMFMMAMKLNPTIPVYDTNNPTGYNVLTGGWEEWNPVADVKLKEDKTKYKNLMASLTTRLKIAKGLDTELMLGIKSNDQQDTDWQSALHKGSIDNHVRGSARLQVEEWQDLSLDWLFNYALDINKHRLRAVFGYSFQEFNHDGFWAENKDFPVDGVKWWDLGSGLFLGEGRASMDSYKDPRSRLIAFLLRGNYSYKDKYLLGISARYEGISKLAPKNRWGLFPAVSVGWRISGEDFMKDTFWLSDLKVRFGYGRTGNADFPTGIPQRLYGMSGWWLENGQWLSTSGQVRNVNKNLRWEKKDEYNWGIDFSFLENRFSGKVDVYRREVRDLIYDISVSQPPNIYDKTTTNTGSLQNTGFEIELNGNLVHNRNWNYFSSIKISHNRTLLRSLSGSRTYWDLKAIDIPGLPGTAMRLEEGKDIGCFYLWKYAGIDDMGNWLLYNKEGKVIPAKEKSQEDKQFIGCAIPKVIWAWENVFTYRNFDLSLFFRSWIGHDIYNIINMCYGIPNMINQNVLQEAYQKNSHIKGEKELCDYWLEDGTFLKLDALTLGYTWRYPFSHRIPQSIRLSLTARNLFCVTGYSGLDPEVNINGIEPGFEERDVYPSVRSFTFGLQFNF